MNIDITIDDYAKIKFAPKDGKNRPEPLDGPVRVRVETGNAVASVLDDGLTVLILAPDVPDTSSVVVEGDAREGTGIVLLTETYLVNSRHPDAVALNGTVTTGSKDDLLPPAVVAPPAPPVEPPVEPPAPVDNTTTAVVPTDSTAPDQGSVV